MLMLVTGLRADEVAAALCGALDLPFVEPGATNAGAIPADAITSDSLAGRQAQVTHHVHLGPNIPQARRGCLYYLPDHTQRMDDLVAAIVEWLRTRSR
jgi:hypothetical protein